MRVVILHGTMGNPEGNWFPWLKKELETKGHEVFVPKFPTPGNQNLESWCKALQGQASFIFGSDTVLIGHSLGAAYILDILDRERKEPVNKAIFVSGFFNKLGNEEFDKLNAPFVKKKFHWNKIKKNAKEIIMFHGDNDPYVSLNEAKALHKKLGGEFNIIKNGGHLNTESGYTEFEELLEKI